MTTIMCEVPGLDGFLSGAAESKQSGTTTYGGVLSGGTAHELARVVPVTPYRAAGGTSAAGVSALC
jgi:hypothetical protein